MLIAELPSAGLRFAWSLFLRRCINSYGQQYLFFDCQPVTDSTQAL